MRLSDFEELKTELTFVDRVLAILEGGDKAQHPLRRWEYAMALKAYRYWSEKPTAVTSVGDFGATKVADHGCCTGLLSPMMYWLGCDVTMYEIWAWGNQEALALRQMEKMNATKQFAGSYRMLHSGLPGLIEEDRNMDVVFCISTLEHIAEYEAAFRDLCRSVASYGMLFITSDFAEHEQDHYIANNVRAGRMFNQAVYARLLSWGMEEGLDLVGGKADWSFDEGCRLIPSQDSGPNGYGFCCLAMERKTKIR